MSQKMQIEANVTYGDVNASDISCAMYWASIVKDISPNHCLKLTTINIDEKVGIDEIISLLSETGWELKNERNSDAHLEMLDPEDHIRYYLSIDYKRNQNKVIVIVLSEGNTRKALKKVIADLDSIIIDERRQGGVYVSFSWKEVAAVNINNSFLRCDEWEKISKNYPSKIGGEVTELMGATKPWSHGKLVIWFGPPGTGKTYAIRSLAYAWKDMYRTVVVTDPEEFFKSPTYYFSCINYYPDQRLLFVFEDSADYVIRESRGNSALSRLLNITDGLLSQGREDLFLITFNEDITNIDPAFTRPGRCLASMNFPEFDIASAQKWFDSYNIEHEASGNMTLAEMYEILHEHTAIVTDGEVLPFTPVVETPSGGNIGFGRPY